MKRIDIYIILGLSISVPLLIVIISALQKPQDIRTIGKEIQITSYPTEELDTYLVMDEADGLVPGFPDIPIYRDAENVQSKAYTEEGGFGHSVEYKTYSTLSGIFHWYLQELTSKGWIVTYRTEFTSEPRNFLLEVERPEILLSVNGITPEDEDNKIIITHHRGMGEYGPPEKYE